MSGKLPYNICPNCGKIITCGCQIKKSLNGTPCCSRCVRQIDMKIIKEKKTNSFNKKRRFL